jgi:aspartyl-tRNA(Asn)/glutamyl-tRNA(Gln) amidotransferase subunit B
MASQFEPVIGLEVHAQLLTDTKIFCSCSTKFSPNANVNVCPVCLGHPGVLPVLNKKVVEFAVLMGLATHCTIRERSILARKNYFYPDLPKGYQISQYDKPLCEDGYIDVEPKGKPVKRVLIKRIHIEEDAGKSIHDMGNDTCIDVNRCGVPLIEIVTEPNISSPEEAFLYLTKIRQIVRYLNICDGNMEEGSLRCDANISMRPVGTTGLGTKAEVKNMNSFRNVERALNYEIERQTEVLEDGGKILQQTLLWDADKNVAIAMRGKEQAHDYRYFPDPDLLPIIVDEAWREQIKSQMPELPEAKRQRFVTDFQLPEYDSDILTQQREVAEYFESVIETTKDFKAASNWVMGEVLRVLNEQKIEIENFPVKPESLGKLINLIGNNTISSKIAKEVFADMLTSGKEAEVIIKEKNLVQISDEGAITKIIEGILEKHPGEIAQYLEGKEKVFGFFIGQIMKETKGKANPQTVNALLRQLLDAKKQ